MGAGFGSGRAKPAYGEGGKSEATHWGKEKTLRRGGLVDEMILDKRRSGWGGVWVGGGLYG